MPQIKISINGRGYELSCGEGQEAHLRTLANRVNERVVDLVKANGPIDETRLLVMASILIMDDWQAEKTTHEETKKKLENAQQAVSEVAVSGDANMERATNYIADVFEDISDRLERVASRIEVV